MQPSSNAAEGTRTATITDALPTPPDSPAATRQDRGVRLAAIAQTRALMRAVALLALALFPGSLALVPAALGQEAPAAKRPLLPGGELRILPAEGVAAGACPLKHTDVQADIAGFLARTTVRQVFSNPLSVKIEAVYVFPLPAGAAVDDMSMVIGERRVRGVVKPREEAREVYEAAKAAGHTASLLDQERPNIFTQSVANIDPGVEVAIEISYTETVSYDDGVFEWVFPMVVGPRYVPGGGSAPAPQTKGEPTPQVPDADKITPPVTPPNTRAGHDVSLRVALDPGMMIDDVSAGLHDIDVQSLTATQASPRFISLRNEGEIPNRDFVLRWRATSQQIADAFFVHEDARGRFFTLILQPPQRVIPEKLVPRELIFVLDTSGSMQGFPIEKAKDVMSKAIASMQPRDTFNLITFAGRTEVLWDAPRPNTAENRATAFALLEKKKGGGGTEMMKAIDAALVQKSAGESSGAIRVVMFLTDGYVGNDMAIIDAVKKNAGTTRVFSFGIGNSVNRFLLDGMAAAGRGEVEYVLLADGADAAVERFHERVLAPVLTDVAIDWGTLPIADVVPALIPDLFSAKPIIIHGRLTGPAEGVVRLSGNTGAGPFSDEIEVHVAADARPHPALASLWARAKVEQLMMQDYAAAQLGQFPEELKRQVTDLGVEFRLMTQFTSFVAVEELTITSGGEPLRIDVPVEMPQGVSYEGVFGEPGVATGRVGFIGAPMRGGTVGGGGGGLTPATATPAAQSGGGAKAGVPVAAKPPAEAAPVGEKLRKEAATAPRGDRFKDADGDGAADELVEITPEQKALRKLAPPLRDLVARVEKDGKEGTLRVELAQPGAAPPESVKSAPAAGAKPSVLLVSKWRVDVMLFVTNLSAETLAKLKELGFEQSGEAKGARVLIGSIDVRKLEALSKLDEVSAVRPVTR